MSARPFDRFGTEGKIECEIEVLVSIFDRYHWGGGRGEGEFFFFRQQDRRADLR